MNSISAELLNFTRAHVYSSFRDPTEREDLIHDIYLVYLSLAGRYSGLDADQFIRLCKTSARNLVRDYIRRSRVRARQVPVDGPFAERVVEIDLTKLDARLEVEGIRSRISEKANIILDALMHDFTRSEICSLSGISNNEYYRTIREVKDAVHH